MTAAGNIFYLMQLAGGTFPSGSFSQSWGLETYVAEGRINDCETFGEFLKTYLEYTVGRCEGPLVCEAYRLAADAADTDDCRRGMAEDLNHAKINMTKDRNEDNMCASERVNRALTAERRSGSSDVTDGTFEKLVKLEELSRAVKATAESRESSLRMGKALLRISAEMFEDELVRRLCSLYGRKGITYPVIYGAVCGTLNTGAADAIRAYVFGTASSLMQSALKLIPLGNTEAQKVLFDSKELMEDAAELSMKTGIDEISNFSPGLDIAGIRHETLAVRLYMS